MTSCRKQRSAVINKHQEWHATSKKQRRTHAMSDRFFAQSPALLMVSKFAGEQHAIQKVLNTHTYAGEYSPAHSCVCGMAWHIYIHTHTHTQAGEYSPARSCVLARLAQRLLRRLIFGFVLLMALMGPTQLLPEESFSGLTFISTA